MTWENVSVNWISHSNPIWDHILCVHQAQTQIVSQTTMILALVEASASALLVKVGIFGSECSNINGELNWFLKYESWIHGI